MFEECSLLEIHVGVREYSEDVVLGKDCTFKANYRTKESRLKAKASQDQRLKFCP